MTPIQVKRRLHEELDLLQALLMEMAGRAEDLVDRAVKAFMERDGDALPSIREDDRRIDRLEVELDDRAVGLIALYQPVASDLRRILTTLKICNDIERVGDHALNIAKAAHRLATLPHLPETPELMELALLSRRMLRDALASFSSRSAELARAVCVRDDRVDGMRKAVKELLVNLMAQDPRQVGPALEYLRVSQQLERIGDLSTNISEEVVFLVEGHSIKHHMEGRTTEAHTD